MLPRLLLAIDVPILRGRLKRLLRQEEVLINAVSSRAQELVQEVGRESYDLVVVSRRTIEDCEADVFKSMLSLPEPPEIIILVDEEDPEDRAHLLGEGCLAVLNAAVSNRALKEALAAALERRRRMMDQTLAAHRNLTKPKLSDFVSASTVMQAFLQMVQRVAPSDTSLLITGETGVGKERLARAIHAEGARTNGPFIALNCGALPEALLESELFGHELGAFTGASRARRGWFELAHGGTIFLDEIAEMPLHLQVKLLHVLQNREVIRVGGNRSIEIDVRVMAATNRALPADVECGRFRRDLYYRLGVVHLEIPPLRERVEDIPTLVRDYVEHFRATIGKASISAVDDAMTALSRYHWPGNVRELINVIERAVLLCDGKEISLADLPDTIRGSSVFSQQSGVAKQNVVHDNDGHDSPLAEINFPSAWMAWFDKPLRQARRLATEEFERAYLAHLLRRTKGRVGETAHWAGIRPRSLFTKMQRYGLRKEDFRK